MTTSASLQTRNSISYFDINEAMKGLAGLAAPSGTSEEYLERGMNTK